MTSLYHGAWEGGAGLSRNGRCLPTGDHVLTTIEAELSGEYTGDEPIMELSFSGTGNQVLNPDSICSSRFVTPNP